MFLEAGITEINCMSDDFGKEFSKVQEKYISITTWNMSASIWLIFTQGYVLQSFTRIPQSTHIYAQDF